MLSRSLDVFRPKYKYLFVIVSILLLSFTLKISRVAVDQPAHFSHRGDALNLPNTNTVKASDNHVTKPDIPYKLQIPKIGLVSTVEVVGLDPDGLMSVPEEGKSVSWYKYGPKPGSMGNSVIAGHYDTADGPAVFHKLRELNVGDSVMVVDTQNTTRNFQVYEVEIVNTEDFDVQKVYGGNTIPSLNLITCHGEYDLNLKTYNQRLIVYAKLK